MLPKHQPYNYTIDLQKGTQPPFGLIYNLPQNELLGMERLHQRQPCKELHPIVKVFNKRTYPFYKEKGIKGRIFINVCRLSGLKQNTVKNCYPLLLISRLLEKLGQTKTYTKVDL